MINFGYTLEQPPHGFVRYIDHLGTDQRIVEAARVSYGSGSKGPEADQKLLNYLYRMRHTSPFEQCSITFNIRMPIFLMRQFVRHRTARLNEVSARYTELPNDFFLPRVWRKQNTEGNKQGSTSVGALKDAWQGEQTEQARLAYSVAYSCYKQMVMDGVAKEQARMVLPVGIYTEIYVNFDLHNLMNFFRLRLDSHAQAEWYDVASAMISIAAQLFPWTVDAFNRYKTTVHDTWEDLPISS